MSPPDVGRCSLWQMQAAIAGWVAVHGAEDDAGGGMTQEAEDEIWAAIQERM